MSQKELNDLEIGLVKDDGAEANYPGYRRQLLSKEHQHLNLNPDGTYEILNTKAVIFPEFPGHLPTMRIKGFTVVDTKTRRTAYGNLSATLVLYTDALGITPQFSPRQMTISYHLLQPADEADPRELTKEMLEKALNGIVWKSRDGHYYCGIREDFDIDEQFEHALERLNGHFLHGKSILP